MTQAPQPTTKADAALRARVGDVPPGIDFPPVALVAAPPLARATVAIVTTAALAHPGEPWADQTHAYRLFDRGDDSLLIAHNSTNFDRSGFALDRNVVYPIDRLAELERAGRLGRVAPRHASFIGSTPDRVSPPTCAATASTWRC